MSAPGNVALLEPVATAGVQQADRALSSMAGRQIRLAVGGGFRFIPWAELPALDRRPSTPSVASHVAVSGDAAGHALLVLPPETCQLLLSQLFGGRPDEYGEPIGQDLWLSYFAEMGNIVCNAFLNALGDASGLRLTPGPPSVAYETAATLLAEMAVVGGAEIDELLILDTELNPDVGPVPGRFVLLFDEASLARLLAGLAGGRK